MSMIDALSPQNHLKMIEKMQTAIEDIFDDERRHDLYHSRKYFNIIDEFFQLGGFAFLTKEEMEVITDHLSRIVFFIRDLITDGEYPEEKIKSLKKQIKIEETKFHKEHPGLRRKKK